MNITLETINSRKAELEKELDGILSKANAISGAIQDCDYWIEQLSKTEEETSKDTPS